MDSEDERQVARSGVDRSNRRDYSIELRLFEHEERRACRRDTDLAGLYRARRLMASVKGFHTGSLDLTGRFERRYASLLARFTPFATSLTAVSQQLAVEWADPTPEDLAEEERWTRLDPDESHFRELGARMRRHKITRRSAAWRSFAEQWTIGEHGTEYMVDELRETLVETFEAIAAHPMPQFQRMKLIDLPPEILHSMARMVAREEGTACVTRLGQTCGLLWDIALHYMYRERRLAIASWRPSERGEAPLLEFLHAEAHRCAALLRADTEMLLARPNVCATVEDLALNLVWLGTPFEAAGISPDDSTFFGPLIEGFERALWACSNVTTLWLGGIQASVSFIRALGGLPRLTTLTLSMLEPASDMLQAVADGTLPVYPQVINLTWMAASHDPWMFILLFPALRLLSLRAFDSAAIMQPSAARALVLGFGTLRRLYITQVDNDEPDDLVDFFAWLSTQGATIDVGMSHTVRALALTHLALSPRLQLVDDERDAVLAALPNMPALRALALEGMQHFYPAQAAELARAAPGLHGLAISLKPSDFHSSPRACVWPEGAYAYAAALRPLLALRQLRWNAVTTPLVPAPGWDLTAFENGGTPTDPYAEDEELWFTPGDAEAADARVFAVCLPALERVLWVEPESPICNVACEISRRAGASAVDVQTKCYDIIRSELYPERNGWPAITREEVNSESSV